MTAPDGFILFLWYGLKVGLNRHEARTVRFGELRELIAVEQIKREGFTRRPTREERQAAMLEALETWG